MRMVQAIFDKGMITFPFEYPDYFEGPVSVMIIFPSPFAQLELFSDDHEPTPSLFHPDPPLIEPVAKRRVTKPIGSYRIGRGRIPPMNTRFCRFGGGIRR